MIVCNIMDSLRRFLQGHGQYPDMCHLALACADDRMVRGKNLRESVVTQHIGSISSLYTHNTLGLSVPASCSTIACFGPRLAILDKAVKLAINSTAAANNMAASGQIGSHPRAAME